MVFNDTTLATDGHIQHFEFWTRMKSGSVTGTLLKQVTALHNRAFDRIMPLLLSYSDHIRWDDINHTDAPIGYINLDANQNDYKITVDGNSLDILNITNVRILPSATDTAYRDLERMTIDDPRATEAMSPDSSVTGTPSAFVEVGSRLYFDVIPSYSATDGIEIFFGREESYFASTDTTKEAGIPKIFHELLTLYSALDWNMVNRTDDSQLIERLQQRIREIEQNLKNFIDLRHPTKNYMTMKGVNHR